MPTRIQWGTDLAVWNGLEWVTPNPSVQAALNVAGPRYPSAWYSPDEGATQAVWLAERFDNLTILELAEPPGENDPPGTIY
jgi:hypothetical protein